MLGIMQDRVAPDKNRVDETNAHLLAALDCARTLAGTSSSDRIWIETTNARLEAAEREKRWCRGRPKAMPSTSMWLEDAIRQRDATPSPLTSANRHVIDLFAQVRGFQQNPAEVLAQFARFDHW